MSSRLGGPRNVAVGLAIVLCVEALGCGAEMIRPRAAGEKFEDRPGRSLVIGQLELEYDDFKKDEQAAVGMTRHRVLVGDSDKLFTDEVPSDGRTFAVWVYPGVFCFGRPTLAGPEKPKLLGKGSPCVEIAKKQTAYYVGSVTWKLKKDRGEIVAELEINDRRESVLASKSLVGIYADTVLVSTDLDPEKVAAKYALP